MATNYIQSNNTDQTKATYGEKSAGVSALQTYLNTKGANLKVDSMYGDQTKAAVAKYGLPTDTGTITSNSLVPVKETKLPETTPTLTSATGLSGAIESGVATDKTQAQQDFEKQKAATETAKEDYAAALKESGKISSSVDRTEQDAAKKLVDKYNSEIDAEALAARRKIEKLQKENPEGLGTGALNAKIADIQRESTALQADKAILKAAALRDYETAASIADRAVEMKMEESVANLAALKLFYEDNKSIMNKTDDRLYQEKIRDEELKVEKERQFEEDIKDVRLEAAKNGAPASVFTALSKIDKNDPLAQYKALSIAGPYMVDSVERNYKIAQTNKLIKESQDAGIGDPMQTIAYAQEYMASGKIPTGLPKGSFGAIAAIAKEMPKVDGQIINRTTGVSPAGDAALSSALGSLNSARKLAADLKELDKRRIGGIVAGTLGKVFGSEDQQRYVDLRSQIVDLLSRARSGAALTPSEEKRYGDMLPGRFSEAFGLGAQSTDRIDNFINALTEDAKNKANAQGWAIYGLSTVKIGNNEYKIGEIIDNGNGAKGRVNEDGTITII